MIATVKYQVATYSGVVQVNCNENDDDEYIIAKAKKNSYSKGWWLTTFRL